MSGFASYDHYDALGLSDLVRRGEVSAQELVQECIDRIERVNPQVNAVVRTLYDTARARSEQAPEGAFGGVPFLVKDLLQCIPGVPTEMGSRFWKGWTPTGETNLYGRWLATGVIPVGKTATPELGLLPVTEPETNGPTRNPWSLDHTSGGSSGGSAAAVAAGIVPMASGGDGGGSIRIPAACCGLFGHKPSRARNPVGPFASEHWSGFVTEHVISRSVRDSAAMLDATQGRDSTAPYDAAPVAGTFLEATLRGPRPLRVALHCEPVVPAKVHPDCKAAVENSARLCEELGHHVEEVSPGHDAEALGVAFVTVLNGNLAADIREAERIRGRAPRMRDFERITWLTQLGGQGISAGGFVLALRELQAEARRLVRVYQDFDVVLTPTLGRPPLRIGELEPKGGDAALQQVVSGLGLKRALAIPQVIRRSARDVFGFACFTQVANFTGWPAMSVPLFWNADGLPIGTMFLGRPEQEPLLFALAAQLERASPWAQRRPPFHAGIGK